MDRQNPLFYFYFTLTTSRRSGSCMPPCMVSISSLLSERNASALLWHPVDTRNLSTINATELSILQSSDRYERLLRKKKKVTRAKKKKKLKTIFTNMLMVHLDVSEIRVENRAKKRDQKTNQHPEWYHFFHDQNRKNNLLQRRWKEKKKKNCKLKLQLKIENWKCEKFLKISK